jgi:hypothetical protein
VFFVALALGSALLIGWPVMQFLSAGDDGLDAGARLMNMLWPWALAVMGGGIPVAWGILPLCASVEIGIDDEGIWRRTCLGPFGIWTKSRPRTAVRKISVYKMAEALTAAIANRLPPHPQPLSPGGARGDMNSSPSPMPVTAATTLALEWADASPLWLS